jgi:aminoglycoside phosphotransferase (APT) family kinase protein
MTRCTLALTPPAALIAAARTHLGDMARRDWHPLTGGRTNRLWRVGPHVVKVYDPMAATPVFPNDPDAEWTVLTHLAETGLAPQPLHRLSGPFGEALIYAYVTGPTGHADLPALARTLSRLHGQEIPAGLRQAANGSRALLRATDALICALRDPAAALHATRHRLAALPPVPPTPPKLIHADPVAANVVTSDRGLVLIDWQCPAMGDPCEDLAIVLSPAMQSAYGRRLTAGKERTFLSAYPDRRSVERYRRLAPYYHLRSAAYALWCLETGRGSDAVSVAEELAAAQAAVSQAAA